MRWLRDERWNISIHAPREGSDNTGYTDGRNSMNFNPRSPRGERLGLLLQAWGQLLHFNPRSPRGERPLSAGEKVIVSTISIHAPREGSDLELLRMSKLYNNFNPRSPRGERPGSRPTLSSPK